MKRAGYDVGPKVKAACDIPKYNADRVTQTVQITACTVRLVGLNVKSNDASKACNAAAKRP